MSTLLGDATKAQKELGWEVKTSFDEMVEEMVLSDLDEAKALILLGQDCLLVSC